MTPSAMNPFGVTGFPVTKLRSKRQPKYTVLMRLKTGMQTDSSDDELSTTPLRWIPTSEEKKCVKGHKKKHWRIKRHVSHLPKFIGGGEKNPLMHVLDLFDAIVWCKPDDLSWHDALLIAFPHSLWGRARVWFNTVKRRKVMTWPQVMDCFLKEFAGSESECILM